MNMFEFNLSRILAHSLVLDSKAEHSPNGIVDDARNGGDPAPLTTQESTAQQLAALTSGLPGLMNAIGSTTLPYQQQIQNAQNVIAPQQAALNNQLYAQYVPQLNAINNSLNNTNALAAAQTGLNILQGPGQAEALQAQAIQQKLDPEYYATRANTGQKVNELLNSFNLNGLSGSERAEVERSNAQQDSSRGIVNAPSQTATVSNAMSFGSALQNKRNALSQAIANATSYLPSSQGQVSALGVAGGNQAQGQSNTNTAGNQFSGVSTSQVGQLGGANNQQASSLMGNINNTALNSANINANRRDTLDRVNSTMTASGNLIGSL